MKFTSLLFAFIASTIMMTAFAGDIFVLLQDPATGAASAVVYATNGTVVTSSLLGWSFLWPLVEVSVDTNTRLVHVVRYPYPTGNVTLFKLPYDLSTMVTEVSSGLGYFDLEYSAGRDTFFGVTVSSPYGRDLSHFTRFSAPVQHTVITSLPYMWFVNASTFDSAATRYFGLMNYALPGTPNVTTQQQLAVGHYADDKDLSTTFLMLTLDAAQAQEAATPFIRFISWSEPASALFGLAMDDDENCIFVSIDTRTGVFTELLQYDNCIPQPMVASSTAPELFAFVGVPEGGRQLVRFDVSGASPPFAIVAEYNDDFLVSGAGWLA